MLEDVRRFMQEYPTETVWVLMTPDYSPINADYLGIVNVSRKNRQKIVKPDSGQLRELVTHIDIRHRG